LTNGEISKMMPLKNMKTSVNK